AFGPALALNPGTTATIKDLAIGGSIGSPALRGACVYSQGPSTVSLERVRLNSCRTFGIDAAGKKSMIHGSNLQIGKLSFPRISTAFSGIDLDAGVHLTLSRFSIALDAAMQETTAGIRLREGIADLSDGTVSGVWDGLLVTEAAGGTFAT